MNKLVWMGIRESEIKYSNFINNSINLFGSNIESLQKQTKKRINHNNEENYDWINDFYNKEVIKKIKEDPNIKFMYYSQIYSYDSMKELGLLDHIVCLNDQKLIKFINSKFKIKEFLKNYIPILDYIYVKGKNCDFRKLNQKYKENKFVIQEEEGSGGFGTIILSEKNKDNINLHDDCTYMVTKYCEGNIPVNIHILISKDKITLLPASIQIIELLNNKLTYKGSDFIAYRELVNSKMDLKLKRYALEIGKLMQEKGYRGIMGIDSIVYNDEVYFMEINPRFQNSSTVLNKALQENNLPSLQELHYNCFFNKGIKIKSFDVYYSCYINEFVKSNEKIDLKPIEKLDEPTEEIECEIASYISTYI